jgi:alanine racemase
MHSSKIYLSKSAYYNNLKFIKKIIGKAKISSVVKGNAYGHGIKEFVSLAEECGINHFSVFNQDEAYQVKKYSKNNSTIMIMGFIFLKNISWVIKNDIEFFVFNFERLEKALKSAKRLKKKIKIHIEVETGLNRTGFAETQIPKLLEILNNNKNHISVKGICTHFAGAESVSNYYRIKNQIKKFKKIIDYFKKKEIEYGDLHTACSAAAVTMPKTRFDMVRVGIMQYGFWPSDETKMFYLVKRKRKTDPLKPILSWESKIMSIKKVKAGEYIGYSNFYLAKDDMRVGTVPVGYSQGYSRTLSNNSWVLVGGDFAEVIGVINMNLFQIDITHLDHVKKSDKVILVGNDNEKDIKFSSFSNLKTSLNYEILTRLSETVPREIID